MPELPEVETIRRQLEPEVVGRRIVGVEVLDARWTRPGSPAALVDAIEGHTIEAADRRGKYLILRLEGERALVMHLRMTGNLLLQGPEHAEVTDLMEVDRFGAPRLYESTPQLRHLRARLELDDGSELLFTDARRFGHAVALRGPEVDAYLNARLGIEPLGGALDGEALCRIAAGRTAPLKSFLLTQSGIAGIGNIYADEALFRAELHPLSPAGSMRPEHCEALAEAIVETLEVALDARGSSIDDYRDARGEMGSMQDQFLVHTREGEQCPRCGDEIRRIVVGGRSTYFSPGCQTRLRRRRRKKRDKAEAAG